LAAANEVASNQGESPIRPHPRIEQLSDMVFGLALSVGALALVTSPPSTSGELYTDIATFGFSFLILIMVWFAYTNIMSVLTLENPVTLGLNTVLLFTVSVEPFLFNVLKGASVTTSFFNTVSDAYAIDIGIMMLVLGLFGLGLATSTHTKLDPTTQTRFRREAINRWVAASIFFASTAPVFDQIVFGGLNLRVWLWFIPLVLFRVSQHTSGRLKAPAA
jgi:uncharacterized membrane protein